MSTMRKAGMDSTPYPPPFIYLKLFSICSSICSSIYLLVFCYAMHILTESSCSAQKPPITLEQQAILQASMEAKRNGIKQEANIYVRPKSSSLIVN
jgi:hypothetical protein